MELKKDQPSRQASNEDADNSGDKKPHSAEKQDTEASDLTTTTDNPTTEYPSAMDKVALDLYAFIQQGQSNLVDATADADSSGESSTQMEDNDTTEPITTTESGSTTLITTVSTTTSTEPSTPSTTTTEPITTSAATTTGRGKFRRPGAPNGAISKTR